MAPHKPPATRRGHQATGVARKTRPAAALTAAWVALAAACLALAGASCGPRREPALARPDGIPHTVALLAAEGYGALSEGGENGRTLRVTNLADHGRGSLRAALNAPGARVIQFQVGGTIQLESPLNVRSGRVTLDGLTAAAYGGITIEGGVRFLDCQDVIIRHLRLRLGYDALAIHRCRRVLIDHVSAAWASDENVDIWESEDVTLQWSIIAEGLADGGHPRGPHSMGSLQGGGSHRVTTHHCLFTGNIDRNPLTSGSRTVLLNGEVSPRFDVINNVMYNYWEGAKAADGAQINYIGNTFRPGPDTGPGKPEIRLSRPDGVQIFSLDNEGPHLVSAGGDAGMTEEADPRSLIMVHPEGGGNTPGSWGGTAATERFFSSRPLPTPDRAQVEIQPSHTALTLVLEQAGAWPRDEEDQRLLAEVLSGEGRIGRVGPRWREILRQFRGGQAPGTSGDR